MFPRGTSSTRAFLVETSKRQNPLLVGFEPCTFGTRGTVPLSCTLSYVNKDGNRTEIQRDRGYDNIRY